MLEAKLPEAGVGRVGQLVSRGLTGFPEKFLPFMPGYGRCGLHPGVKYQEIGMSRSEEAQGDSR
jgi:hypothetical protein